MIRAEWSTLREAMRDMRGLAGDPVEHDIRGASLEDAVKIAGDIMDDELTVDRENAQLRGTLDWIRKEHEEAVKELEAWRALGQKIIESNVTRATIKGQVEGLLISFPAGD